MVDAVLTCHVWAPDMTWLVDYASIYSFFFFNDTATTEIYTLSLHDALPISHERSDFTHLAIGYTPRYFNPRSHERSDEACKEEARWRRHFNPRSHEGSDNLYTRHYRYIRNFNPRSHERSEEHTSELQSRENLVCRLLLEKKKKKKKKKKKHQIKSLRLNTSRT